MPNALSHFRNFKFVKIRPKALLGAVITSFILLFSDASAVVFDTHIPTDSERQRILHGSPYRSGGGATGCTGLDCIELRPGMRVVSLRNWMSPVKNQGSRGTCSVFAATALLEYNSKFIYSEQCLAKMSSDEDGGTIAQRVQWALGHWLNTEASCKYDGNEFGRDTMPSLDEVLRGPLIFSMKVYSHDTDPIQEIRSAILNGTPVGVSVLIIGKWWGDLRDKRISPMPSDKEIKEWQAECDRNPKKCGSHALVVTGFDDITETLEFKNSWGTTYKDQGYGKISYEYLRRLHTNNPFVTVSQVPSVFPLLRRQFSSPSRGGYGCHKGYCWAYKFENYRRGDPWCYTQICGVPGNQKTWAKCSSDDDCDWTMTCGDNKLYFGDNDFNALIYGGESDAASLRSKNDNSNCGTKPGYQCGCHRGYCWAYKFEKSRGGDPWCWTQRKGVPGNQKAWATCSTNYDCDWAMTCGDNNLYFGSGDINALIYGGEPDAASVRSKSSNCGIKPGNQCGCHKGYCWAYKFEKSRGGDPWCWTQRKGVPGNQKAWATCSTDYDCDWSMTCGDNKLYFGGDDINALIYGGESDAKSIKLKYRKM